MTLRTVTRSVLQRGLRAIAGAGGLSIPSMLRQLLFAGRPAYYTDDKWSGNSHLLKDYSSGVGSLREKRLGYCYDFDGVNDVVILGNSLTNTPFSFAAWTYQDSVATTEVVLDSPTNGWQVYFFQGALYFGKNGVAGVNADGTVTAAVWHHVAVTYDGANVRFYINGVLNSTKAFTQTFTDNNKTLSRNSATGLDGRLHDVRVYSGLLTADEVTHIYTNGLSGTDPGKVNLVAHYPLQEETGTTAYDISGNDHHGTITGAVTSGVGSIHQPDAGVTKSYPNDEGYSTLLVGDNTANAKTLLIADPTAMTNVQIELWLQTTDETAILFANNSGVSPFFGCWDANVGAASEQGVSTVVYRVDGVIVPSTRTALQAAITDGAVHKLEITVSTLVNFSNGLWFSGYVHSSYYYGGTIWGLKINGVPFDFDVKVPAKSPTQDALGGTLTYTGRAPQPGLVKDYGWQGNGSTVRVELENYSLAVDSIEFYMHNDTEINTNATGTRVIATTSVPWLSLFGNASSLLTDETWVILGTNREINTAGFTFVKTIIPPGWHKYKIEWSSILSRYRMFIDEVEQEVFSGSSHSAKFSSADLMFLAGNTPAASHAGHTLGPVSITTGGITTAYAPIPGTRNVAKLLSSGTGSIITDAVKNGVLADLYTLGDGSWRSPAVENGGHWDGTSLVPAAPGATVAANGNAINIPANKHPRSVLVDRTGGIIAPLDYVMETDNYTAEEYNDTTTENTVDKRVGTNYSDRHGAATSDISGVAYFD